MRFEIRASLSISATNHMPVGNKKMTGLVMFPNESRRVPKVGIVDEHLNRHGR
jgi:hypothetical protein